MCMMASRAKHYSGKRQGGSQPMAPAINVDLWDEILDVLLLSSNLFEWVKVPSHVEKEKADQLAERGRKLSPLYSLIRLPVRQPVTPPLSPPPRLRLGSSTGL